MSKMLEQAIIDAEALKDASPQVKLYGSDQLYNGTVNTLQQALGVKASDKRIRVIRAVVRVL